MNSKLIIFFSLIFCSCVRTLPDEELTMTRIAYNGKEIRLDGYYTGAQPNQNKYFDYIFFYTNGVVFSFGNLPDINLSQYLGGSTRKPDWSVFQIKNNVINLQGWTENGSDFVRQYVLKDDSYTIINDTTLFYETSKGYKTTYHFKKFSPKPDSTNVFIK